MFKAELVKHSLPLSIEAGQRRNSVQLRTQRDTASRHLPSVLPTSTASGTHAAIHRCLSIAFEISYRMLWHTLVRLRRLEEEQRMSTVVHYYAGYEFPPGYQQYRLCPY
ncbi:hypothetical protein BIW11_10063 [Tropilaelaps mercedesae]|uniref:Uncharacterized protein n=1 Tax=Tropilaelaps mercedesae TaxID=418985 RepID=A0A1V9XHC7_9ACAR|nr:hypothetical protein BIW11_10063 [Tropilaelaps mercedesae]